LFQEEKECFNYPHQPWILYNFTMSFIAPAVLNYKALIIPAAVWFIAQLLKLIIVLITEKRLDFGQLTTMGGMPSAHSATVCSLATAIGKIGGFDSLVFALSAIFALIVMYDAGGVRQTVSNQSVVLNRIIDEMFKGNPQFEERLKEFIGHSRLEIGVGALIGVGLAWWWA
jgi:acid phosphatase family membrane protein YuiD